MEVIVGFAGALIEAATHIAIVLAHLLARVVAFVIAFIFAAWSRGPSAAIAALRKDSDSQRKRSNPSAPVEVSQPEAASDAATTVPQPVVAILVIAMVATIGAGMWLALERFLHQRRLAETTTRLNYVANRFAGQLRTGDFNIPDPGPLSERDAWQQPLVLLVDHQPQGIKITVRSNGPDRQPGTLDDLQMTLFVPATAKEVGGEFVKRVLDRIREKAARRIPREN